MNDAWTMEMKRKISKIQAIETCWRAAENRFMLRLFEQQETKQFRTFSVMRWIEFHGIYDGLNIQ